MPLHKEGRALWRGTEQGGMGHIGEASRDCFWPQVEVRVWLWMEVLVKCVKLYNTHHRLV